MLSKSHQARKQKVNEDSRVGQSFKGSKGCPSRPTSLARSNFLKVLCFPNDAIIWGKSIQTTSQCVCLCGGGGNFRLKSQYNSYKKSSISKVLTILSMKTKYWFPSAHIKKKLTKVLGMVVLPCNPKSGNAETGRALDSLPPSQPVYSDS